jgi:uncharacterized protein YegP (UPF0339 family)
MRLILISIASFTLFIASAATLQTPAARAADAKETASNYTFEVYKDKAGEFRWRLLASNGQNIASSGQGYSEKRSCLSAIESIKRHAADAKIEEKTDAK